MPTPTMQQNVRTAHLRSRRKQRYESWKKGMNTYGKVAMTALRVAKEVKGLVNVEIKWLDTIATSTAVNTTPAINSLTAIAQGVTENQRIGESVKAKNLSLRLNLKWNGTSADAKYAQRARILLVRDLQQGAVTSAPIIGNILQNTANAQQLMQSYINKDQGKRWNILFDKIFVQDNEVGGITIDYYYKFAKDTRQIDRVSRKCDPHIRFHSAGATDYEFGHVWLIIIGDLPSGTATATAEYMARLNYIDN